MERIAALTKAEELVGRLMVGPANGRGYKDLPVSPTLAERTESILRIAEWLLVEDYPEENASPHVQGHETLHENPPVPAPPPPPIGFAV